MSLNLIIRNATLPDGRSGIDIGIKGERIVETRPKLQASAELEIDAGGHLVTPPFVDPHFHMDATLTTGIPRRNVMGTLFEGIAIWSELKQIITEEAVYNRAIQLCEWAIARGNLAIRSHVDVCDPRLTGVRALLEVKKKMKPYIDIQLVAFPQEGLFRFAGGETLLRQALDMGVDVVGGIPHFERTMQHGHDSVRTLCEIAAERGLLIDMHCDESDDPLSRHVEMLAYHTHRLGLQGRVSASHVTSMRTMDNYYFSKLSALVREAGINVIANPLTNSKGDGDSEHYPKYRGVTRIKELKRRSINVAFGHDCCLDPWYPLGTYDMLEVAHMGIHEAQMNSVAEMEGAVDSITYAGAKSMCLDGYGLEPGNYADMVVLAAADRIEAVRLRADRLHVIRRGKVIVRTKPADITVSLDGRESKVNFLRADHDHSKH